MKIAALTLLASLVAVSAAAAQDAAPVSAADSLPKAYSDYTHPDVTADSCKAIDASNVQCVIPAMTAGRYRITAAGTSTAKDAQAVQALAIGGDGWVCGRASTKPDPAKPWASGPRTFKLACQVTLLSDQALVVHAAYADSHAVKSPKGPVLSFERLPWNGVVDAQPIGAGVQ